MAGPGVFHVAFGINETKLTQTLEKRCHEDAEKMIRENLHPTYLDEGCYQRTPLYIVLCGKGQNDESVLRNLHLAKLLVEHGASVNYRVPATYFGAEYMDPGQSAVELVTDLYNALSQHPGVSGSAPDGCWPGQPRPNDLLILGLDQKLISNVSDALDQLLDLLLTMLGQGGDLNIRDWYGMTPLHRTVIFSTDVRLADLLCEWGSDVNAQDLYGNTPLGSLCDAFPLGAGWCLDEEDDPSSMYFYDKALTQRNKSDFSRLLLKQKTTKLDIQNKLGRTALFNAVVRGDAESAALLLAAGCDPTLRGQVTTGIKEHRRLSPLFVSLCSLRVCEDGPRPDSLPDTHHYLCHLVDAGYFSKSQILSELHEYIDEDFPAYSHLKLFGIDLISLMFGATTATLRQLATRAVFTERLQHEWRHNASNIQHVQQMAPESLVSELDLPRSSSIYVETEMLRLALFTSFAHYQWLNLEDIEELRDSDDSTSTENDSDLEYW